MFFLNNLITDGNKISYLDYAVYGFHAQFYVHNG